MKLSIIVPFFNSYEKCKRLIDRLCSVNDPTVEVVFVDDGSTDCTVSLLQEFKQISQVTCTVLVQDNKGPGGARNSGLAVAQGEYVWFVDSDDDINLSAVDVLDKLRAERYDFIDFDYLSGGAALNSMDCPPGTYVVDDVLRKTLLNNFGRICTKLFRREWLEKNHIVYPEFCIYEDNALLFFVPFMVTRFYKSNVIGYVHYEDYPSITRSKISWRYFDRMSTALFGLSRGLSLSSGDEKTILSEKFIQLYLINTTRKLMNRRFANFGIVARIMKQYRMVSGVHDVKINPLSGFLKGSARRKSVFFILWMVSYLLPDQTSYFEEIRRKAWEKSLGQYTDVS